MNILFRYVNPYTEKKLPFQRYAQIKIYQKKAAPFIYAGGLLPIANSFFNIIWHKTYFEQQYAALTGLHEALQKFPHATTG